MNKDSYHQRKSLFIQHLSILDVLCRNR
ncbi:hypothetical protein KJ966_01935 [bacterium]|nr:hypothetical protein [bacterium]